MRAAVLTEHRPALELVELDDPETGTGEVLLEVTACGICGSDLHVASEYAPPGSILGHEIAGVVAELGPDVDGWEVGTPVVARPLTGCGTCNWCTGGRPDHCAENQLIGFGEPGGFAELVRVPARELFAVPVDAGPAEQALVEPLAVARRALRRVDLRSGEDVLVIGGGPVGLAVTAWARALGAGRILVSEPVDVRRDLARTLGADATVDPSADDLMAAVARDLGGPPPVVVECSGVPGMIGDSMFQTAVDGRVGVVGLCMQNDEIFPFFGIQKELDVRFSIYYGREDYLDTIAALDAHDLVAAPMITETITMEQLPERFVQMATQPDAGKVVVLP